MSARIIRTQQAPPGDMDGRFISLGKRRRRERNTNKIKEIKKRRETTPGRK